MMDGAGLALSAYEGGEGHGRGPSTGQISSGVLDIIKGPLQPGLPAPGRLLCVREINCSVILGHCYPALFSLTHTRRDFILTGTLLWVE